MRKEDETMAENNVNTTVVETPEMEKRFHDEYTVKMIRSRL